MIQYQKSYKLKPELDLEINTPYSGDSYTTDNRLTLFQIRPTDPKEILTHSELTQELNKLKYKIEYESIYEEKFEISFSHKEQYQ